MPLPHVDVDSGTFIVIDPLYLERLLDLTRNQANDWQSHWTAFAQIADLHDGMASFRASATKDGLMVTRFGIDGAFKPAEIAKILTRKHEEVCIRIDHSRCIIRCGS